MINNEYSIKGCFCPLVLNLTKINYELLFQIIFYNITYDDK